MEALESTSTKNTLRFPDVTRSHPEVTDEATTHWKIEIPDTKFKFQNELLTQGIIT